MFTVFADEAAARDNDELTVIHENINDYFLNPKECGALITVIVI